MNLPKNKTYKMHYNNSNIGVEDMIKYWRGTLSEEGVAWINSKMKKDNSFEDAMEHLKEYMALKNNDQEVINYFTKTQEKLLTKIVNNQEKSTQRTTLKGEDWKKVFEFKLHKEVLDYLEIIGFCLLVLTGLGSVIYFAKPLSDMIASINLDWDLTEKFVMVIAVCSLIIIIPRPAPKLNPYYYHPSPSGCLSPIIGFLTMTALLLLMIYGTYRFCDLGKDSNFEIVSEPYLPEKRILPSRESQISPNTPPKLDSSDIIFTDAILWGELYSPDIKSGINVSRYPKKERGSFMSYEINHFYIQKAVAPTIERALRQLFRFNENFPNQVHIAYDLEKSQYPFKILIGPFPSKREAEQFLDGESVWVRDLNKETNLVFLEMIP